jgi:porin
MNNNILPRFKRLCFAVGFVALSLVVGLSRVDAQEINSGVSIGPSQELSQPPAELSDASSSAETLFGSWGGVRTYLHNHGIEVLLDVTSEFAGNVSGGTKQLSTFANQVGFEADINWQKLAGIYGLSTHVVLVNRSGNNTSAGFGDNLVPVQEIYGSGGNTLVHLVYAFAEENLFKGRLNITAGRFPTSIDFAASPLYCNFMNNSLCGNPKALPGEIGFSSYPDNVWAGRVRVWPTLTTYVQVGAFEVSRNIYNYAKGFRSGFNFSTNGDTGAYFPIEAAWEPRFGSDRLPGHYKVGFGYDTSNYPDLFADASGNAAILTGRPFRSDHGRSQVWALFDQMLWRQGKGDTDGIILLGGAVHNETQTSIYAEQYFVGLLDSGFWKARPSDTIGLLFSYNTVSGQLGKTQALALEFGLPTAGTTLIPGIQTHEMSLEVNYDIHVFRGINFQPEFQYVFRPNAQGNIKDAAVLGFKTHVEF